MASLLSDARRYAREFQKKLGLRDWQFEVRLAQVPHGDANAWATCSCCTDYRSVEIHVCVDIPPTDLRHAMAHEVLHAVLWPLDQAVRDVCDGGRAPAHYDRAEETAINQIAAALAKEAG